MRVKLSNKSAGGGVCGCFIWLVLINLTIGAVAFNYCMDSFFGKSAPFLLNVVGGLFLGEITIPVAVISAIARAAGVHAPFFPGH